MAKGRTFYVIKNLKTGVVNQIVRLGLPFMIRTIILRILGAEYLGLSSLFSSILQVLNMTELGFSSAVVFSLYKPIAQKDTDTICALMNFYRKAYTAIGTVILIAGSFLFPILPKLIKGSYPANINIYLLYAIYLVSTSCSYMLFAYKTVLFSASQRQNVLNNVNSIISVVKFSVQILFLLLFKNYYLYIIWNVVFTVAENFFVAYLAKKEFPDYFSRGTLQKGKRKEITQQVKGLAVGKIANVTRNAFDSIVLSMYCGLIDVAIYSNYYYLFHAVIGVLGIIIQSINAGLGNSIATESKEKNYRDFKKFYFYFSWIGSACTTCFYCLYQPFMKLWAGSEYLASSVTMTLFCIYFYIIQMGLIRSAYSNACGIWWECKHIEIFEMLSNLALNFILGYFWGMNGILIATIITVFLFSVMNLTRILLKICFQKNMFEYLRDSLLYAAITIPVVLFTSRIVQSVPGNTIISFVVQGVACVIISNMIFATIYFCIPVTRSYLMDLVKKIR